MTWAQAMNGSAMSTTQSGRRTFAAVAARWILANLLPQVLLVAAAGAYLGMNGFSLVAWINDGTFADRPDPLWFVIGTAVLYIVISISLRGAVLRPLVPRFTLLGWVPAALLTAALMLALTTAGSLIGLAIAKGLQVTNAETIPVPGGLKLIPFAVGMILATEIMGLILGGLPGSIIAAGEALVVGRATRSVWKWILWSAAGWSTVMTFVLLHAFLVVFHRTVSPDLLRALAAAMPIILGLAAGLVTLPAVARLARRQNGGE